MSDLTRTPNRPGLQAIAYRVGTHASFLANMLQRLSSETLPSATDPTELRQPPLARLTTRSANDPAIALIDAWATVADVLTFYQERIANEGYLRTATERQSILLLARAIGYELNPGVAANALLAFTVEDAAGAPGFATLPVGVKVSSIPVQSELPQTFETVEAATVRAEWNVLRPRTTGPQTLDLDATEVLLAGVANVIESGDGLLLLDPASAQHWDFRVVRSVETVPSGGFTRVTWTQPLGPLGVVQADAFEVHVFRQRAALFGHNAPDFRAMPDSVKAAYGAPTGTEWPNFAIAAGPHIDLDTVYPRILPDTWAILTSQGGTQLYHVEDVLPAARTDFTLSAKVSRLLLDRSTGLSAFGLRDTFVLAQSEALPLAERPIVEPIGGSTIVLDRLVAGLHAGQRVMLADGTSTEDSIIDSVTNDTERTTLALAAPLAHTFDPATLRLNANVVRATHGETVSNEVLGSGQGGTPNQRFSLAKPPLTHVSAATATGAQSTLEVRVDGIQWQQAQSLFGAGPRDQIFAVRIEDDGQTQVVFGDGVMGARPSSGNENLTATYRSGIGPAGNVGAGGLALVQARPPGIRTVSNPLAASGAAAPENLDDARTNAPLTVLTLDRIVSLRDFEDFSRAFAGVGKAQAVQLWSGRAHFAHITVGGVDGGPVDPVATLPNLLAAIDRVRDPAHEVLVQSYAPRSFGIAAQVLVDPRHASSVVLGAAAAAIASAFSFVARSFGQAASAAEIVTVIQSVPGVQAVTLTRLLLLDPPSAATAAPPPFLSAAGARWTGSDALPAELILVDPASIALTEMQAVA